MEVTVISTLEIQIEEFKPWLEKEAITILKPLNDQGGKIIDKLRERLSDVRESWEKLAEEGNRELERGRAVRKAKATEKLTRFFLKQIDKIVFPDELTYSTLEKLHKDLEQMSSSVMKERNAWFPRISPLFIIARTRADFVFSRLAGSISDLGGFLSSGYSTARVVEEALVETEEMMRLLDSVSQYEGRKADIEQKMRSLSSMIDESEQKIQTIGSRTELDSLAEMKQRTQLLRKQVVHDFRHLRKPFMKFANLTRGPQYALSAEESEKLSQYLEDPFEALATEKEGCPTLKGLLKKVQRALNDGKLNLKSSRLRKAQEKIDAILNENSFASLYESCSQAFSSTQEIASSAETRGAQKMLRQSQRRLGELLKRRKAAALRMEALEQEHGQMLKRVEEKKALLEKLAFDVVGEEISIDLKS